MKIRWREHEALLITLVGTILIASYLWHMLQLSTQQSAAYPAPFIKDHVGYSYFTRVLLPQVGSIIVLWVCYIWINRLIIPAIAVRSKVTFGNVSLSALQFVVLAYIIGPCVNFASFYSNPHYTADTWVTQVPFTLGFHPQPFLNLFGGISEAFLLLLVYVAYAMFREIVIHQLTKDPKKSFGVFITNQVTIWLVAFFALPAFTSIFHLVNDSQYYAYYFALTPPSFCAFIDNVYRLFPNNEGRPFLAWRFAGPLLFTTFIYSLAFSIFLGPNWSLFTVMGNWLLLVVFITPVSWQDYRQRKDKILQLVTVERALARSSADLQFLRSQINPHFLFNALNTLYGTALIEGSTKTAEGIQKLGDMMRFMLHENTLDLIPMEKEIEYLKNYIALQKLRTQTSPNILIEDNIDDSKCSHMIAPMLLIPFVENAFKHGVSLNEKSWIKIKLECDEQFISFEVRNSVHHYSADDPEREQSGIGLNNVQERLLILYKGRHHFIHGVEGNEYVARLKVEPAKGNTSTKTAKLSTVIC